MIGLRHRPVVRQAFLFALVGAAGFLVDAAVLTAIQAVFGDWIYSGQLVAYVVAATATWQMNRNFTFDARHGTGRLREWARYLLVNAGGGTINYATFAGLVSLVTLCRAHPVMAVAAGGIAGLAFNFTATRSLVFVGRVPAPAKALGPQS